MTKCVSKEALTEAVGTLAVFKLKVQPQGLQHVLPLLSLKRKGAQIGREIEYEEQDDFDFFDQYCLVDPESTDGRYYDPFAGVRRIATHPHSNVATARKGTFAASWRAATFRTEDGATYWQLEPGYLAIVQAKALTKAGEVTLVPVDELFAWMFRQESFDDSVTPQGLRSLFKERFKLELTRSR